MYDNGYTINSMYLNVGASISPIQYPKLSILGKIWYKISCCSKSFLIWGRAMYKLDIYWRVHVRSWINWILCGWISVWFKIYAALPLLLRFPMFQVHPNRRQYTNFLILILITNFYIQDAENKIGWTYLLISSEVEWINTSAIYQITREIHTKVYIPLLCSGRG